MTNEESWFGVRLVFESLFPGEPGHDRFFEEQIVLVRATDEDSAAEKAKADAVAREHTYLNAYEKPVRVVFGEVLDVFELFDGTPGEFSEVYSNFLNERELTDIRNSLEPGSADRRWPGHDSTSPSKAAPKVRRKTARPARTK